MLWHVILAVEDLLKAWEVKLADPHFKPYWSALEDGLDKITKYYKLFDRNPAIVLAICKISIYFILSSLKFCT